jgi:hypothetical protein
MFDWKAPHSPTIPKQRYVATRLYQKSYSFVPPNLHNSQQMHMDSVTSSAQTHQQPDTCSLTPSFSRFLSSPASRTSSRKDYRSRDIICPADTSCHLFFPPLRSPTSHNYRTSLPRLTRHEAGLLDPTIRTVVLRLPHVRILTGGT